VDIRITTFRYNAAAGRPAKAQNFVLASSVVGGGGKFHHI